MKARSAFAQFVVPCSRLARHVLPLLLLCAPLPLSGQALAHQPADPGLAPMERTTDPAAALAQQAATLPPLSGWVEKVPRGLVNDAWCWQIVPEGLIFPSYLAGMRESRMAGMWVHQKGHGWLLDSALGGRVGLLRYGSDGMPRPNGWQLDVEGATFPQLDLEHDRDLVATDFRIGVPLTFGYGRYQAKFAFYHLSSHLGDEFMLRFPGVERINYSRNALVWGNSFYPADDLRLYAEAGWAFYTDGGTQPWEFQFGIDYSPAEPSTGLRGAPFVALNTHLRQEVDYGGNFSLQTGWQWRSQEGHLFRMGVQYVTGKSEQFEFFREHEDKLGLAFWYDY